METKAIVFTYTGQTVSGETLGKMVMALAEYTEIKGNINTHCFDSDDIAKACLEAINRAVRSKDEVYTPEEYAFIYVAELIKHISKWPFRQFCAQTASLLDYNDEKLVNALKILGNTGHLTIRKELLEKYEFIGCASHLGFLKTLGRNVLNLSNTAWRKSQTRECNSLFT